MGASMGVIVREVIKDGQSVATDEADTFVRASHFAIKAGSLTGKSVAWIGGGLCIGPLVFAISDCKQTVYEIEPALAEFCPEGVRFVPGDWQDTLTGTFDVIVFDLGGEAPKALLTPHLAPGGLLLGAD